MRTLRIATAAYPVTAPRTYAAWEAKLDAFLTQGLRGNPDLLLLPEYACMELAASFPGAGDPALELQHVAARADDILATFRRAAIQHRVWLAPGSIPRHEGGRVRNLAPLIAPDGRVALQEKHIMTRFESESWGVASGADPRAFETPFGPLGLAVCYDSEFPDLVRAQAEAGAWLTLVPSCTDTAHGHNRVRIACRARALETQSFVALAATVGDAPQLATLDCNIGRAAIYGPVDRGFPDDGIIAETRLNEPGWIHADLDRAALDAVREGGAVRNWQDRPHVRPHCTVDETLAARPQTPAA